MRSSSLYKSYGLSNVHIISDRDGDFSARAMLDNDVACFFKDRVFSSHTIINQSYLNFWMFVRFANIQPKSLKIIIEDRYAEPCGNISIFMPAASFFVWMAAPGRYRYEAYMGAVAMEETYMQSPLLFSHDAGDQINSSADIINLIKKNADYEVRTVRPRSYVADKTKLFLEKNFTEDLSFTEISKELNIPVSTMTHGFKGYYGIAPTQYRSMIRSYQALYHIQNGMSVTEAGYMAGFGSKSQFHDHFKRHLRVSPSSFARK